ncbi:MAG: hypothetical protein ACXWM7_05050 [Parachlamydiaceae bacterium]
MTPISSASLCQQTSSLDIKEKVKITSRRSVYHVGFNQPLKAPKPKDYLEIVDLLAYQVIGALQMSHVSSKDSKKIQKLQQNAKVLKLSKSREETLLRRSYLVLLYAQSQKSRSLKGYIEKSGLLADLRAIYVLYHIAMDMNKFLKSDLKSRKYIFIKKSVSENDRIQKYHEKTEEYVKQIKDVLIDEPANVSGFAAAHNLRKFICLTPVERSKLLRDLEALK